MGAKKILLIRSSSMGDIIHALPTAHDIRSALPNCELDWVVEESFAQMPLLSPAVDNVIVTAFRRWRKRPFSVEVRREIESVKTHLREREYDIVIDLQGLIRSALVARWSKAFSVGYCWSCAKEPLATLAYQRKVNLPCVASPIDRYRLLAAQALGYEVDLSERIFGLKVQAEPALSLEGDYAILAVNTSRDSKLWSESSWIELANTLREERGLKSVFFWGSSDEFERVHRLSDRIEGSVVAPRSELLNIAATLSCAKLLVGVDTGLAHLGAALGLPSVGVFVSTSSQQYALTGDGPCISVGGLGACPSVDYVLECVKKVLS